MTSNQKARPLLTWMAAAAVETQGDDETRREQEEKLILTAWRNMSSAVQLHSKAPGPVLSFLSRQRQSTRTRRAPFPPPQPSSDHPSPAGV
ncbi:protein Hook homolog 2-like [Antennarius striatus]|uniref:protein Hook homolog 2-like n=1 Tax=Antennarius striatus TaxID=241820 RepID=UPI0035B164F2